MEKVISYMLYDKLYVKWKAYMICLTAGLIKKTFFYKMSYFPEPYTRGKNKIKVKLNLFNYATKSDGRCRQIKIC